MYFLCIGSFNHLIYLIMKKQFNFKMSLEVIYSDGRIETSTDSARKIRERFSNLVHDCLDIYICGIREIRLVDSSNRVFKSYIQHF